MLTAYYSGARFPTIAWSNNATELMGNFSIFMHIPFKRSRKLHERILIYHLDISNGYYNDKHSTDLVVEVQ